MQSREALFVATVVAGLFLPGCSDSTPNPFPAEVNAISTPFVADLHLGSTMLDPVLAPTGVQNPHAADVSTTPGVVIAASGDAHAGTVANVDFTFTETRAPDGSSTFTFTCEDAANPGRLFISGSGSAGRAKISLQAPPIGAQDFLVMGTGQAFGIMVITRTITLTRTFTNVPSGDTTSLVNFAGAPAIASVADGTATITQYSEERYLVEYDIAAVGTDATIVDIHDIGEIKRITNTAGPAVTQMNLSRTVNVDTASGTESALFHPFASFVTVGPDPSATSSIADMDNINIFGSVSGGVAGIPDSDLEGSVDDLTDDTTLTSDNNTLGGGTVLDGDWDESRSFDLDVQITADANQNPPPGSPEINNGTIEIDVVDVEAKQMSDAATDGNIAHPLDGELIDYVYGIPETSHQFGVVIMH